MHRKQQPVERGHEQKASAGIYRALSVLRECSLFSAVKGGAHHLMARVCVDAATHRVPLVHHFIQLFGDALHLLMFSHFTRIPLPSVVRLWCGENLHGCRRTNSPRLSHFVSLYAVRLSPPLPAACLPLVCCCDTVGRWEMEFLFSLFAPLTKAF